MKKIYLASPLFTDEERIAVRKHAEFQRSLGNEVYVPMEHQIENAWSYVNDEWARRVFNADINAISNCDEVHVIYYGLYSDSGTAWECGFAYALGKPVIIYPVHDIFAKVSLMVAQCAENKHIFKDNEQT